MSAGSRRTLRALMLGALLAGLAMPAVAQQANGAIEGTIKDASGAVLPGVTVTVHNNDTGEDRVVITDANGLFRAPLLPLGRYKVSAELSGFKKHEENDIPISTGAAAVINFAMEIGRVEEVVSVTTDASVVGCRSRLARALSK